MVPNSSSLTLDPIRFYKEHAIFSCKRARTINVTGEDKIKGKRNRATPTRDAHTSNLNEEGGATCNHVPGLDLITSHIRPPHAVAFYPFMIFMITSKSSQQFALEFDLYYERPRPKP
uniref:Uncharacterized protein n=1 Tax=Rhizophora mucronata TaxID=61149 RepID=A0A2P2PBQ9_RHIMU